MFTSRKLMAPIHVGMVSAVSLLSIKEAPDEIAVIGLSWKDPDRSATSTDRQLSMQQAG
jgi:hypothetical protein